MKNYWLDNKYRWFKESCLLDNTDYPAPSWMDKIVTPSFINCDIVLGPFFEREFKAEFVILDDRNLYKEINNYFIAAFTTHKCQLVSARYTQSRNQAVKTGKIWWQDVCTLIAKCP